MTTCYVTSIYLDPHSPIPRTPFPCEKNAMAIPPSDSMFQLSNHTRFHLYIDFTIALSPFVLLVPCDVDTCMYVCLCGHAHINMRVHNVLIYTHVCMCTYVQICSMPSQEHVRTHKCMYSTCMHVYRLQICMCVHMHFVQTSV